LETLQNILPLAAEEEGGGSFLVSPGLGLMIWTLIAFLISFYILKRAAYPRIQEALEKRANAVAVDRRRQADARGGRPAASGVPRAAA
jgi:F-type H+-transporting ATPase subunit b